jgi:hypothetical protein
MLDVFNLPLKENSTLFTSSSFFEQIFVWNKPRNAKLIYFYLVGGGGGGGAGRSSALNGSTGGGGGGSGAITTAIIAANLLPDILYIMPGRGGTGGISAITTSESGFTTYVFFVPNFLNPINTFLIANGGNGGGVGGSSVQGTAGSGGAVWNYTTTTYGDIGLITSDAGQSGGVGTTLAGTITNITPTLPVTGGAGGGATSNAGSPYNGGSITGSGFLPTVKAGINDSATNALNGGQGFIFNQKSEPMLFTGGAGGGASGTGTNRPGGIGGNGGYGSGGGGGGGAYNGAGGAGGRGGNGFAMISWI